MNFRSAAGNEQYAMRPLGGGLWQYIVKEAAKDNVQNVRAL